MTRYHEYIAHPVQWIDKMTAPQYKRACLPCHCGRCGKDAGSLIQKEVYIPLEAGQTMHVNTRTSRLCASCFPIVVTELQKEYAHARHNLAPLRLVYSFPVFRDGVQVENREGWGEE